MIKIPYEQVIGKIREKSGLSEEEISQRIKAKLDQLSGLVSKEGAAHIVANELGIKLFDQVAGKLQIRNILSGMRDVETVGKVLRVYEAKPFKVENREGRVGSFVLGDETGSIRVVLWNEQADNLRKIKEGDTVKVVGGYVRERINGVEVHLNDRSRLVINPPGETIEVRNKRKKISALNEKDTEAEIVATIVQVFDPRFFEICPACGKRVHYRDDSFFCDKHEKVTPDYSYVINAFVDDGSDNIRAVFFRRQAQQLLEKNDSQILVYKDDISLFEQVKVDLLGDQVKIAGRVVKNQMFDRLEIIAQHVSKADVEQEIQKLGEEVAELKQEKQVE
jgi:replication factor A1